MSKSPATTTESPTNGGDASPSANSLGLIIKTVQKTNKKSWQLEEDTKLLTLVKEWGTTGYWKEVSSRIENRTSKQCRERYFHHLSPDLKKTGWTKEEDAIIIDMREKLGNHWTKVSLVISTKIPVLTITEITVLLSPL